LLKGGHFNHAALAFAGFAERGVQVLKTANLLKQMVEALGHRAFEKNFERPAAPVLWGTEDQEISKSN
jgi:hypothetical protein